MADEGKQYENEVMRRLGAFTRRASGGASAPENSEAAQMRRNRAINRKTAAAGGPTSGGGGSAQFATGRPRDPLFYWKQNNLPYDFNESDELSRVREYTRLLYSSHPIIGSCVDIYSKYPLLGMELTSKDEKVTEFYQDLFFDEDRLNYNEFTVDIGREYWTVGEAWPFGSFNESLGIWEDDELLNPEDVEVERSPFLREPRFYIKLPESLRNIIEKRSPAWEYEKLMQAYPELARYTDQNALMPVSSVLLRQYKFKGDTFNKRGVPLLMRAMRSVMQEEMLNSAMDAIADRLYTPLILVKLGASASDLGTNTPWIPTPDDLEDFNESLDMAMAADFRVLTHHFGIQMESVFGRENMPDFSGDFERLEGRILQTFGLSQTMLNGASSGQTYAADALNRDLVSQLLTTYQRMIAKHYRQRALVVAEAQGHYDYDERNGQRYVKMEEVLEVDEETGEERIVEQPKLLIPDMHFRTMNLSDEESQRQFLEQLHDAGVPISIKSRMVNIPINLKDEIESTKDEQVRLAVAEQEVRKEQFLALRSAGLPIPADLLADFQPRANTVAGDAAATEGSRTPVMGLDPTVDTPNLDPNQQDMMADQVAGVVMPGQGAMPVDPIAAQQQIMDQQGSAVPPESNEQRAGMPTAAQLFRNASKMRSIAEEHYRPEEEFSAPLLDSDGNVCKDATGEPIMLSGTPSGKFAAPKHIGMRRHDNTVGGSEPKEEPVEDA